MSRVQTRSVPRMKTVCVFLFVFLCVSLRTVFCQSGPPCQRPNGGFGSCIAFQSCDYYVNVLSELGATLATDILRKAHCGFEANSPKVCCPALGSSSTTTPIATEKPSAELRSGGEDYVTAFPEAPVCGQTNAKFNKVVNGVNAKVDDWPWMALLGYNTSIGHDWKCGGSLITVRHVLTAAHCIYNLEHKLYVVRLGELDLAREDDGAYPIDFLIKKKITHEQYSPNTHENDIGLLILQNDVQFTKSIHPICIPKEAFWQTRNLVDQNPFLAGWGRTSFEGTPAIHLQTAQVPILDNSNCVQAYKTYTKQVIDQSVICAGIGGSDACQGDSGGPLMMPIRSTQWNKFFFYAIGVISYGRGCATAEFPGIYTRVTRFVPWIEEKVTGHTTG